ncbi:ABC transporter permease [Lagierella sp.]|uniref:ABC transporter permease n=1 Tax=Lagierella sp. TaxID=2849657 RepID=UPI002625D866|nr:ABC transporter permease [Lagierella sp.]
MKFSVLFADALNAIKRNKKRSILTMLGIIIGIGAVITIISIGNGFQKFVMENLTEEGDENLSIAIQFIPKNQNLYENPNIEFFSQQDLADISAIDEVEKVELAQPSDEFNTYNLEVETVYGQKTAFVGVVENTDDTIIEGRNLTDVDNELEERVAIIGDKKAKELFKNYSETIGSPLVINGLEYTIVGVYEQKAGGLTIGMPNSEISIPKKTYEKFKQENPNSSALEVFIKSGANVKETAEKITDRLKETGSMKDVGTYEFFDISEMMEGISNVLKQITLFIALIGSISLFIAGIGMMNMMFISVSERTKEIGIRRAIGATKGNITLQFLLEGVTVTVIGGIFGYLFGLAMAMLISAFLPFKASVELGPILTALGISLGIGIIFSYAPAKSAANKNVIEILS